MMRSSRAASAFVSVAVLLALAFVVVAPQVVRADPNDPSDPDYWISGPGASGSGSTPQKNQDATKKAVAKEASTTAEATATTGGGGTSGPAIVPAATPLVIDSYASDPVLLQAGSQFNLTLTIKNPGTDDAEDVVVQIGPASDSSWGGTDDFVVLGSGTAKYIGTLAGGATNANAAFTVMANPAVPGGMRSVPVKMTWKSQGYEHTALQAIGLLVNSAVSFETSMGPKGTVSKDATFPVSLTIQNTSSKTVKDVDVLFSGSGARPSDATTVSVGDMNAGTGRTLTMAYTAPLVGRAKLTAVISYLDDFGSRRTVQVTGWAHVLRAAPPQPQDDTGDSPDIGQQLLAFVSALLGVS